MGTKKTKYNNQYFKEHYVDIDFRFPKGAKKILKQIAANKNMTINDMVSDCVAKHTGINISIRGGSNGV